jgi:putative ABC transport system substrate-binding protein
MAQAFQAITTTIPIVTITSEPVALGLATSLPRPGGNITGFTVDAGTEVVGKRLELLKEAVPSATRVAFLATEQAWNGMWGRVMREAAERTGATSIAATVGSPIGESEYRRAFAVMAKERAQALVVTDHAEGVANRKLIVDLAAQAGLPAIYAYGSFVEAGGLMAYGIEHADLRRRVAGYIDRILKGARPAELPFQQPTKFELIINLKTAKALDLTIPPSLLQRADQVIK